MLPVLLDNLTVIILSCIAAVTAKSPGLFLICAGLMMVALTAGSMDIKTGPVKYLFAVLYAVCGGSFVSFAIVAILREISPALRALLAFSGFLIYKAVYMLITETGGSESFAKDILSGFILLGIVSFIMLLQFVINSAIKKAAAERERLTRANLSELHEKRLNRELVEQNLLAEKNARLKERENISRNIHNSVGHSITAAIMTLDAADMLYDVKPEEARKRMNDANERIRGSLESIRRAVRTLDEEGKPLALSDLTGDFNGIIDEFVMDTKLTVDRSYKLDIPENGQEKTELLIPHEHAEFLTGVLKELLTNGVKHGNADYFLVTLGGDRAHLRLAVKDNGKSDFNAANGSVRIENGFGIKKIISYVTRYGGKAEFTNENGFKAVVELPFYNI